MQGFNDFEGLDPAFVLEILRGVEGMETSAFLDVFAPMSVKQMSGSVPYIDSKYTMLQDDEDANPTKIGLSDDPDVIDLNLNSVDFKFDHKYSKKAKIHKGMVETLQDLENSEDLVGYLGKIVNVNIASRIDLDGASILQSTTLNEEVTAADTWGGTNSDFFSDMDDLVDSVGQPDTAWLGLDVARKAASTSEVREKISNFDGGGRMAFNDLVSLIQNRYGFERVMVDGSRWYHDDNQAQTLNKKRIFDGTMWVGNADQLIVVDRPDLEEAFTEYNGGSQNFELVGHRYFDAQRAEKAQGAVLTGY